MYTTKNLLTLKMYIVYEHIKLLLFKLSLFICIQFLMLYINMIYEIIVSKFENSNLSPHDDAGGRIIKHFKKILKCIRGMT